MFIGEKRSEDGDGGKRMSLFGYHVEVNPIPVPYTIPDGRGNGFFAAKHSCCGGCIFSYLYNENALLFTMRTTPDRITELRPGEIFVFGSNLAGMHGGGAARLASLKFGAVWGQGVGLQGQSYAIPTMQGGVETIRPYVDEFIGFARQHPRMTFLVTEIGCGIAGFTPAEIAPLFEAARRVENIHLPARFWDVLGR